MSSNLTSYEQGFMAYHINGLSYSANPYELGSWPHDEWARGNADAQWPVE